MWIARPVPVRALSDHVDLGAPAVAYRPERRSGAVTQPRARSGSQYHRQPASAARQHGMAYREHAAMDAMQPPAPEAMRDRAALEPQLGQLGTRHDAVLTRRQLSDQPVHRTSRTFCTHVMHNVRLDLHPQIVPKQA
jgi:hypothetical protein